GLGLAAGEGEGLTPGSRLGGCAAAWLQDATKTASSTAPIARLDRAAIVPSNVSPELLLQWERSAAANVTSALLALPSCGGQAPRQPLTATRSRASGLARQEFPESLFVEDRDPQLLRLQELGARVLARDDIVGLARHGSGGLAAGHTDRVLGGLARELL